MAAKKKWASQMTVQRLVHSDETTAKNYITLVENSSESATPTPVIIKTGNFKVQVDAFASVTSTNRNLVGGIAFIAYVPQGYALEDQTPGRLVMVNFIRQHPEWILAWKQLDFSSSSGTATTDTVSTSFSSRLKRNLNSGDKIIYCVAYQTDGLWPSTSNTFTYQVACQYWTCAN